MKIENTSTGEKPTAKTWSESVRFSDGRRTRKTQKRLLWSWFGEFSAKGAVATRDEIELCRQYGVNPKHVESAVEKAEILGCGWGTDWDRIVSENPARAMELALAHLNSCWLRIQPHRKAGPYHPGFFASESISQIQATIRAFPLALPIHTLREIAQPDVFSLCNIEVWDDCNSRTFAELLRTAISKATN